MRVEMQQQYALKRRPQAVLHLTCPLIALPLPSLYTAETREIYLDLNFGLLVCAASLPALFAFCGSGDGNEDLGVAHLEI